jgi:capsular polysaccharide transport system permease protein
MFALVVIAPTLLATLYYGLIAAPMYESEAQFVVREKSDASSGSSESGGGLLSSMGLGGGAGGNDTSHAIEVQQYMTSRDAVAELERDHNLRALLNRPEGDFISRFPRPFETPSFENLFWGFQRFVTVGLDDQKGISTVKVVAYRPEDAKALAEALLEGGEGLVNRMNARSLADTVGSTERELADAETQAAKAQATVTAFRNHERIVDPTLASQADVQLMTGLEQQIDALRAQRSGLAASAPQSPQLPVLDKNIAAFQAQIDAEHARSAGQANSLAPKLGEYERLLLDEDIAGKQLTAAEASLEHARLEAMRTQLYLERVVNPNAPDKSEQPERLRTIFTVFIASLVAYAALSLLVAGLREHRQD